MVRTLNEVPGQLVRTLAAVGEAKNAPPDAPAEGGVEQGAQPAGGD
jgi:hypothetical protein